MNASRWAGALGGEILMPSIGLLMGKFNFSSLFLKLWGQAYPSLEATKSDRAHTVNYGVFSQTATTRSHVCPSDDCGGITCVSRITFRDEEPNPGRSIAGYKRGGPR